MFFQVLQLVILIIVFLGGLRSLIAPVRYVSMEAKAIAEGLNVFLRTAAQTTTVC